MLLIYSNSGSCLLKKKKKFPVSIHLTLAEGPANSPSLVNAGSPIREAVDLGTATAGLFRN